MRGKLVLISTPIGNLRDLSPRAMEALEKVDLLACEDTRHTGRLLASLGIKATRLISLHEHNERQRVDLILQRLEEGQDVAIVSDAGTPLVSDPGFVVVREVIGRGGQVESIPGPSAILSALVVSGLAPLPFSFLGFPPPKTGKRQRFLEKYRDLNHTLILFESPHRLIRCLQDAQSVFGPGRPGCIARELTKMHEDIRRGTLKSLEESYSGKARIRGEIVLLIGPPPKPSKRGATDISISTEIPGA